MARVSNSFILHGLSGTLGERLVLRKQRNGNYIVGPAPRARSGRAPTAKQKAQQERFREAVLYASANKGRAEYAALAKSRGVTTFNVATSDFMHPPEIAAIDLTDYSGAKGDTVDVTATDDVKVATVGVSIVTDAGVVVEKGQAVVSAADPHRWVYTATSAAPRPTSVMVVVEATDLAGHVTELRVHT